jgi:hypothetical protein
MFFPAHPALCPEGTGFAYLLFFKFIFLKSASLLMALSPRSRLASLGARSGAGWLASPARLIFFLFYCCFFRFFLIFYCGKLVENLLK